MHECLFLPPRYINVLAHKVEQQRKSKQFRREFPQPQIRNHYLGGEFCILNKIESSKVILDGEIFIQVQA